MKKRLGFVSNSSSSSFIIIFDEEPKNTGDIKRMLFGDKTIISYYDNNITTNLASDIIFKDIEKATKQKLEADFDSIIYSMEYFKPEAWLIDGDDKEAKKVIKGLEKKYSIKIKYDGENQADISGTKESLKKYMLGPDYDMDEEDLIDLFPELG